METGGHELWTACMHGDPQAWATMLEYNEHDVVLTEEVYLELRGWAGAHPNYGLYTAADESPCCTVCGSDNLIRKGWHYTSVSAFQRFQCKDCGKKMRGRKNFAKKDGLLTNCG